MGNGEFRAKNISTIQKQLHDRLKLLQERSDKGYSCLRELNDVNNNSRRTLDGSQYVLECLKKRLDAASEDLKSAGNNFLNENFSAVKVEIENGLSKADGGLNDSEALIGMLRIAFSPCFPSD